MFRLHTRTLIFSLAAVLMGISPAYAQSEDDDASDTMTSDEGDMAVEPMPEEAEGDGYMDRYPPQAGTFELGFFGGLMFPSSNHSLIGDDPQGRMIQDFSGSGLDFGGRFGFYPTEFLGIEAELGYVPLETDDGESASWLLYRAHVLAQLPGSSITPFVVLGTGFISSSSDSMGDDTDQAVHFGAGVKFALGKMVNLRFDLRDSISNERADGDGFPNHIETLLGLSFILGGEEPPPPPPDTDGDGIIDVDDQCPNEPGPAPEGCPIGDADGDGIFDNVDKCPETPGVAEFEGCPDPDRDKDGFLNEDDKCPDEPGTKPAGCPNLDWDKDTIQNDVDKCPREPENFNNYEDDDGCPDAIPEEVKKFSGVIEGILFATGKSDIRAQSKPKLDDAAKVLVNYPKLRIQIVGHTDDRGKEESNKTLSQERADSVKTYLISKGVDAARIKTRGAGEAEPRDSNDNAKGRERNRRIEFKLIQ